MQRRSGPKGFKSVYRGFFMLEPANSIGGPAGFFNGMFERMETEMDANGAKRPYGIVFLGGDGRTVPVRVEMFEAAK